MDSINTFTWFRYVKIIFKPINNINKTTQTLINNPSHENDNDRTDLNIDNINNTYHEIKKLQNSKDIYNYNINLVIEIDAIINYINIILCSNNLSEFISIFQHQKIQSKLNRRLQKKIEIKVT